MNLVHATCVRMHDAGLLLTGLSGSGKSDLALRLIGRGARLVGDDYVYVGSENGALYAVAPLEIAGKLEVRGIGIAELGHARICRVAAVIELCSDAIDRLPQSRTAVIDGVSLPLLSLNPFEAAACEKLLILLQGLLPKGAARVGRFGDHGFDA